MKQLIDNFRAVKNRIELAVKRHNVSSTPLLLAVSKKHLLEKIMVLAEQGQRDFGESYAQEGVEKIEQCTDKSLIWHFIGPIQSNKVKLIATYFDWVHSVERMKVVNLLIKHRPSEAGRMNVLLQLKVGDEDSKSGAGLDELFAMAAVVDAADNLNLRGVMCIPPPSDDFTQQQGYFNAAYEAFERLKTTYPYIDTLSMGMSGDLEAAIACGSTVVRVGTDLFGQRQ
ncbi:YggS family pyridoxal phosphate-dependent enzyme [Marinicella sp. S1101]|uniref:YggS family pyridoxal phosphate-dependent enzyme n=1 Tax=Marinicella marina TaxID=2996016 RepID=UPI0022608FD8|nr:YggS family pyridoxal phosphate-dependent enzyme [Marinicella marina]MCX7554546.1 YggS family pyridoxal phosphate-dependent enzyme [Marinicella marina]MDJ1141070.1 YggS family pyridoxal phosphate-dependent enzyme [Marinicella marina]